MANIKLGELLLKANVLKENQLKAALSEQQKWGGKLGDILVRMSLLSEDLLIRALSKQLGLSVANLNAVEELDAALMAKIPIALAREVMAVPLQLREEGKALVVAMAEPQNVVYLDKLRSVANCRILPQLAGRAAVTQAIGRLYQPTHELPEADATFKMIDSLGRTIVRRPPPSPPAKPAPQAPAPASPDLKVVPRSPALSPQEAVRMIEEAQRGDAAALKAIVDLLIEKRVFTREEYLAKLRR
jgi:hypothetical protein